MPYRINSPKKLMVRCLNCYPFIISSASVLLYIFSVLIVLQINPLSISSLNKVEIDSELELFILKLE